MRFENIELNPKNLSAEDRLVRAKIQLQAKAPFFAYILLHMKLKEENTWCETMAIDAKGTLYWNRKWLTALSEEELMGSVCHETLHVCFLHLIKKTGRDEYVFNVAADLVINDIIINQQQGFRLPKCGLVPNHNHECDLKKLNYTIKELNNKHAEGVYDEIYPLFPKSPKIKITITPLSGKSGSGEKGQNGQKGKKGQKGQKGQQDQDSGQNGQNGTGELSGFDIHIYGDGEEGSDGSGKGKGKELGKRVKLDLEQKWKKIIAEALAQAKQRGQVPAGLERMVEDVLESRVDWRTRLYRFMVAQLIHDYSWSMPNKRTIGIGIYTPRPVRENVHIVTSIDTSGSIGKEELTVFLSELVGITRQFPNLKLDVIICDAKVHETYELTNPNIEKILGMKMSGRGGTSHKPVYEHTLENIRDCRILINFTDGRSDIQSIDPHKYPFESLWVISKGGCNKEDIPFGEVIKLD